MWTGITLLYLACTVLGFIFALIGAIFGEISSHGGLESAGSEVGHEVDGGGGIDAGHEMEIGSHTVGMEMGDHGGMPEASVFNTITIATFVAFFGLSGLLATLVFGLSTLPSLMFALPTAMLVATVEFLLYVKVFIRSQASSEATMFETLGCEADVITTIPADRVGEISYIIKGCRYTAPAASADNTDIPRGTRVRVVNLRGNVYVVRPV